jgi:hypothetical protein
VNQTQVAAALGIPVPTFLMLARNPAFPKPTGSVNGVITWASGDITAFLVLWNAAKAHGWKPVPAALASFPFTVAAAANPGPGYDPEGQNDPRLLDL